MDPDGQIAVPVFAANCPRYIIFSKVIRPVPPPGDTSVSMRCSSDLVPSGVYPSSDPILCELHPPLSSSASFSRRGVPDISTRHKVF